MDVSVTRIMALWDRRRSTNSSAKFRAYFVSLVCNFLMLFFFTEREKGRAEHYLLEKSLGIRFMIMTTTINIICLSIWVTCWNAATSPRKLTLRLRTLGRTISRWRNPNTYILFVWFFHLSRMVRWRVWLGLPVSLSRSWQWGIMLIFVASLIYR